MYPKTSAVMIGNHEDIFICGTIGGTVDGRNPANQLSLVVYPMICRVVTTSKWWLFGISDPSTVG